MDAPDDTKPKLSRPAQWALNAIFACLSFVFSLVVAELIYERYEPKKQFFTSTTHMKFLQYDPLIGWANRPGAQEKFDTFSFSTHVKINKDGLRADHDVGAKNRYRVALIGDSNPFGFGVEEDQRFSNLAAKQLHIDILNFSVIGYNLLEYYLSLDRMLTYKPDMVVVCFTLNNDFNNVSNVEPFVQAYSPYGELQNGQLNIKGYPIPDYTLYDKYRHNKFGTWVKRFALGRLLFITLHAKAPNLFAYLFTDTVPPLPPAEGLVNFQNSWVYEGPNQPVVKKAMAVNEAILRAMKQKLDERKVPFVIYAIRTRKDENDNAITLLKHMTHALGIELIYDSTSYDNDNLSFMEDEHWTRRGQKHAATFLQTYLAAHIPKPAAK